MNAPYHVLKGLSPAAFEELAALVAASGAPHRIMPDGTLSLDRCWVEAPSSHILTAGDITIDRHLGDVIFPNCRVRMTKKARSLLELFVRNPARVIPFNDLLRPIWGRAYVDDPQGRQALRAYLVTIRCILKNHGSAAAIESVSGEGYIFKPGLPGPANIGEPGFAWRAGMRFTRADGLTICEVVRLTDDESRVVIRHGAAWGLGVLMLTHHLDGTYPYRPAFSVVGAVS